MRPALLALELSPQPSSIAVWAPAELSPPPAAGPELHERSFGGERGRALLHEIDCLLREAGVARAALAGLIVGIGPGSYTGLRIACTAARTLGYALGCPVGGISSFAAAIAAQAGTAAQPVHVLLDAFRGEVYHASGFGDFTTLQLTQAPRVLPAEALAAPSAAASWLCDPRMQAQHEDAATLRYAPRAVDLLKLAHARGVRADGTGFDALDAPEPLYLRAAAFRPQAGS